RRWWPARPGAAAMPDRAAVRSSRRPPWRPRGTPPRTGGNRWPSPTPPPAPAGWACRGLAGPGPWTSGEPGRLALLQEGLHALAALVAGTNVGDALDRRGDQRGVDLALGHVLHQPLARLERVRAGGQEGLDEAVHLGVQLL